MNYQLPLIIVAAVAISACDAPTRRAAAAPHTPSGTSITVPNKGFIPGTPKGDLGDWVKDIRKGVADLPELAAKDAPAAQRKALDLYVTRQEYSEMYYGVDGRHKATEELAQAIETAEARFHELMKLLGTKSPSVDAVQASVDALDAQQANVAKLWKKSGSRLDRPTE